MRIPLTVIGGFLGAGKTTLLNRCLREAPAGSVVLVNDFGSIGIDEQLIARRDGDTIALSNGCVCCQIGDDLGRALDQVLRRSPAPPWVVIEASGISDPWRIAQVGLVEPLLTLDGVIVVVDAEAVRAQLADPLLADTVLRQWRGADVLVLNKIDRVAPAERPRLQAWLTSRAGPDTPWFEARHGDLPWAALTGVHQTWPVDAATASGDSPGGEAYLGSRIAPAAHGRQFESWSGHWEQPLRADALRALLRAMPAGVLRLKGIVCTDRHACAELQFAGRHGSLRRLDLPPGWDGGSRVVAIGLCGRLPGEVLRQAFGSAVVAAGAGLASVGDAV